MFIFGLFFIIIPPFEFISTKKIYLKAVFKKTCLGFSLKEPAVTHENLYNEYILVLK